MNLLKKTVLAFALISVFGAAHAGNKEQLDSNNAAVNSRLVSFQKDMVAVHDCGFAVDECAKAYGVASASRVFLIAALHESIEKGGIEAKLARDAMQWILHADDHLSPFVNRLITYVEKTSGHGLMGYNFQSSRVSIGDVSEKRLLEFAADSITGDVPPSSVAVGFRVRG